METINSLIMAMAFGPVPEHKNDNELLAHYSARLADAAEPLKKILRHLANDRMISMAETRRLACAALEAVGERPAPDVEEKQEPEKDEMLGPNPGSTNKVYVAYVRYDNGMYHSYAWARNKDPNAVLTKLFIIGDHVSSNLDWAKHDIRFTGHDREYWRHYPDGYCFVDLGEFEDSSALGHRISALEKEVR